MPPSAFRIEEITAAMRERLLNGLYPRGSRLPVRKDLQAEYRTSPDVMQAVFNTLREDGQLVARGRLGSYVVDHPPCLDRFAWIYPLDWAHYGALAMHRDLKTFCGNINESNECPHYMWYYHADDNDRLKEDIARRRVAALILPVGGFSDWTRHLKAWPDIPTVRFAYSEDIEPPAKATVPTLVFPLGQFLARALNILREQGARKIAIWTLGPLGPAYRRAWEAQLAARNMESHPLWEIVSEVHTTAHQTSYLLRLLQQTPVGLPEGIVIYDDNLAGAVHGGIESLELAAPDRLRIVCHSHGTSIPWDRHTPAASLGFSIRDIVAACTDLIRRQQADRGSTPLVTLPLREF